MSKLIIDQIQRSGGSAISFPATDGTAGQFLVTDTSGNLSFANTYTFPGISSLLLTPEGVGNVGTIVTHTERQNTYSTGEWGSSGPWTTYNNNQAHLDSSLIQFVNMLLGDGMSASGTSETFIGDSDKEYTRRLEFASGNRVGYARDQFYYDNTTGNAGHSFRMMPVRNTTSAAITVTFSGYVSDYWSSGYEGTDLFIIAPNAGLYSAVTSITTTSLATSSTTTRQTSLTGTYSIPANTTVLVCLTSTDQYQTTYRFKDTNFFYGLSTTFTNAGIICDMRMLSSLATTKFNLPYTGAAVGTALLAPLWTKTATTYGDR